MLNKELEKDSSMKSMDRRVFFSLVGAAAAGLAFLHYRNDDSIAVEAAPGGSPKMVKIVEFTDAGVKQDVVEVPKIVKPDSEWRKQLTSAEFDITRRADTEIAYTGKYWNLHDEGIYRCICCDTALFTSETKFDSGTGWPSFWQPLAKENVEEQSDGSLGMQRIAVACRRCDAHLGHVFDDGPKPTGLRYCMNSASLRFVKG